MKIIPNVPIKYEFFPDGFINDVNGWAFNKRTIDSNKGNLLTLDIDFGSYCSLNCPACFRKNNSVDKIKKELTSDELKDTIRQAKKLGLKSVKFLGAGDPFENFGFFDFLKFLHEQNIIPLIFTKGHVLGSDDMVKKYFTEYGITSSEKLIDELYKMNVSILLGFNSFDDKVQAKMVGGKLDYILLRNRALELLIERGFNNSNPTRIALAANPITIWNMNEAFEIYKWARFRNLYPIITPTMISGRAKDKTWSAINPSEEDLINLYTQIYMFNIEYNIQSYDQIMQEGISSYAGGHPCNQVSTGLYVTLHGKVLSCPGSEENVEGNIWYNTLEEIWLNSSNRKRNGTWNCQCIAKDGKSIPITLYKEVLWNLEHLITQKEVL